MHLVQIGNQVINIEQITLARFQYDKDKTALSLCFPDDGASMHIYDDEAIALWRYITAATHCKKIGPEPTETLG